MDELLSNRIELTNDALKDYKLTAFGQKIEWKRLGRISDIQT